MIRQENNTFGHIPVLVREVLEYLEPCPGKTYVDATLGGGGHAREILRRIQPDGRLVGFEQDPFILEQTKQELPEFGNNIQFIHDNFSTLRQHLNELGIHHLDGGLLADLGVSSFQLDQAERGFSFLKEAPLDMRMGLATQTAADIVNNYPENELVRIFSEYGEERFSKTIARQIIERRKSHPFETTTDLANVIKGIYAGVRGPKDKFRIHPATRVFQALRIEVNDELGHLKDLLEQLPQCLTPGARVVVISFHSLEDRIVKRAFRDYSRHSGEPGGEPVMKLLTSKPVMASEEERAQNPRSRSARLRAAQML